MICPICGRKGRKGHIRHHPICTLHILEKWHGQTVRAICDCGREYRMNKLAAHQGEHPVCPQCRGEETP